MELTGIDVIMHLQSILMLDLGVSDIQVSLDPDIGPDTPDVVRVTTPLTSRPVEETQDYSLRMWVTTFRNSVISDLVHYCSQEHVEIINPTVYIEEHDVLYQFCIVGYRRNAQRLLLD